MSELKNRYLSLDVFRGMDVALMILVNTPGSWQTAYSPLLHADWNGFTLTDLVFPTFLFVVGNSMSFALPKYEAMGNAAFMKKILKRAAIIFLLGFLGYWFPFFENGHLKPLADTRIFGVLQRIALCYLFASFIIHYWKVKGALIFSLVALVLYRVILGAFGDLTLEGNAAQKLDLWLIGESHMYKGEGIPFDPEGLLSTLPSIVNVIAGYVAGLFLQRSGQNYETLAKMMMVGCALVLMGFWWDLFFPFNKKLWTSSFVLLTVGIDMLVLPILVFLIDIAKKTSWTYFFEVFGKNTLFIYLLSQVFSELLWIFKIGENSAYSWIADNVFMNNLGAYLGSFVFALWFLLICWGVGYFMDKKKIYVKV
jgi:predicted acyltransferase